MDILKIYPSGRVTASRRKKFNPARFSGVYALTEQQEWDSKQVHLHGFEDAIAAKLATNGLDPLGLSSVANLTTEAETLTPPRKLKRGSKGISSASRQLVRDACTLLEEKYGKERLSFITHTIPDEFIDSTHANWQSILHNLRRRYIRALQKAGLPKEVVMVTEYQEERLVKHGKAVLHLHILIVGRHIKRTWQYKCEYYHQHWKECCEEYNRQHRDERLWSAATRVESIRKSAASYLSKYMSKGVATLASIVASDPNAFIPPSWHVLSQQLRTKVRRATRHFEGKTATEIYDFLLQNAVELLKFNRHIKVPTSTGRKVCVGWYADLKDKKLFQSVALL